MIFLQKVLFCEQKSAKFLSLSYKMSNFFKRLRELTEIEIKDRYKAAKTAHSGRGNTIKFGVSD
ncbi:MAG: hypothetical protein A2026_20535 [Deltaproteobacteria bacterium RBG_19FT_COMBO_46_12]|nr:MAG: hypothetical protein A2026_20535 [Deltaproteobacteria bacterium RBG_19FT_COMBO_46_12]